MGSGARSSRSSGSFRRRVAGSRRSYVVCLSNDGYAASLEERKIYERLDDKDAERLGLVRVVDESGEDYLFPRSRFIAIALPREVAAALAVAS